MRETKVMNIIDRRDRVLGMMFELFLVYFPVNQHVDLLLSQVLRDFEEVNVFEWINL